jgi:hypothetical protein
MFTNPVFTGTVTGVTKTHVGLGNVTNESKATMFTNPVFTGTVTGVTKTHVGLGNVTNESKATMFTRPVFSESAKVVDNNPIMEIQSNSAGYLNAPVTRKLKWSNFAGDESGNINLFDFSQESVGTEMAFTIKSHANGSLIEALRINGFGKIGIGTTAPEMPLDVCGAFGLPANTGAVSKGIMRVGYYQHAAWGGTELNFGIVNDNTLGYPSWIQSQMPGAYENNRPLLLNPNGGNVGIGTNNPGSKLDVNGEIRATSFVGRAYPYTTNIGSGADVSDTHMLAGSTSGQKAFVDVWGGNNASYQNLITFGTSSFERMRIAANGNVGIGTTNPTQSLDVNGTIIANDIIIR